MSEDQKLVLAEIKACIAEMPTVSHWLGRRWLRNEPQT